MAPMDVAMQAMNKMSVNPRFGGRAAEATGKPMQRGPASQSAPAQLNAMAQAPAPTGGAQASKGPSWFFAPGYPAAATSGVKKSQSTHSFMDSFRSVRSENSEGKTPTGRGGNSPYNLRASPAGFRDYGSPSGYGVGRAPTGRSPIGKRAKPKPAAKPEARVDR